MFYKNNNANGNEWESVKLIFISTALFAQEDTIYAIIVPQSQGTLSKVLLKCWMSSTQF